MIEWGHTNEKIKKLDRYADKVGEFIEKIENKERLCDIDSLDVAR